MTLPSISEVHLLEGPLHVLIDSTGLKVYGAGEWLSKLHLAVDAASGQIVASALTGQNVDNPSQVGPLLDQIAQVTGDGAYDGEPTYETIAARGADIAVVIPSRHFGGERVRRDCITPWRARAHDRGP